MNLTQTGSSSSPYQHSCSGSFVNNYPKWEGRNFPITQKLPNRAETSQTGRNFSNGQKLLKREETSRSGSGADWLSTFRDLCPDDVNRMESNQNSNRINRIHSNAIERMRLSNTIEYECKRGYARSGTYVCQQKVEKRPKKRCPLKAPENYL